MTTVKPLYRLLLNPFLERLGLLNNLFLERLGLLMTKEKYLRTSKPNGKGTQNINNSHEPLVYSPYSRNIETTEVPYFSITLVKLSQQLSNLKET